MSDQVRVQDGRRAPFLWCSLATMRHLRATLPPGQKLIGARNVYVGIAELAADRYAGQHEGFEATRAEIAEKAGTTDRRVGGHLATLEAIGLLEITTRTTLRGATLPSVYCLKEPTIEAEVAIERFHELEARQAQGGGDETSPHQESARTLRRGGDEVSDETSPPTRPRVTQEEVKEDGRTEGPRAHAREAGGSEQQVLAELQALADDRSVPLDRSDVLDAVRSHPGIAHLTAARRLRETYGSTGPAARRIIRDLAAIFRAELDQRLPEQPRTAARKTRRQATPSHQRKTGLTVHLSPPAGMELPGERLIEAWHAIRKQLEQCTSESTWFLWLEPIDLAGFYSTVVEELGETGEKVRRVLVLTTPSESAAWIANSFGRTLEACAAAVLGPDVGVELLPNEGRSVA